LKRHVGREEKVKINKQHGGLVGRLVSARECRIILLAVMVPLAVFVAMVDANAK